MKKIFSPMIIMLFFACSPKGNPTPPETAEEKQQSSLTEVAKEETDATTGATSKANQVSFNGVLVLPPQHAATVALTMGGIVKNTTLIPGAYVQKNSILATLENPEFIELQQTYIDSRAQLDYLEAEYQRQKSLSSEQAASQKKFQQSKADYLSMKSRTEASAAQLSLLGIQPESLLEIGIQPLLQVKAPISGYIGNLLINIGKYMNAGEPLCEIVDKTKVLLRMTAYEKDLREIQEKDTVEFRVNGIPDQLFYASVISIGQKVDESTRSLDVYARINNPDQQFRPGMYVTARIKK